MKFNLKTRQSLEIVVDQRALRARERAKKELNLRKQTQMRDQLKVVKDPDQRVLKENQLRKEELRVRDLKVQYQLKEKVKAKQLKKEVPKVEDLNPQCLPRARQ